MTAPAKDADEVALRRANRVTGLTLVVLTVLFIWLVYVVGLFVMAHVR